MSKKVTILAVALLIAVVACREMDINTLTEKADEGSVDAQFTLGMAYKEGEGVEQDPENATYWFRQAAEQGQAEAQYELAHAYWSGNGVEEEDAEQATNWLRKAAEQGHAEAQYDLGIAYEYGFGVEENRPEAGRWYRQAVRSWKETRRDARAQFMVGEAYADGRGVQENITEAVHWWRKAAKQEIAEAQHQLGWAYALGEGVRKITRKPCAGGEVPPSRTTKTRGSSYPLPIASVLIKASKSPPIREMRRRSTC